MLAEKDSTVLPTRDSAVSFLQEQHANTLHGLHLEIQKLQKKCASKPFMIGTQRIYWSPYSTRTDV